LSWQKMKLSDRHFFLGASRRRLRTHISWAMSS
jgi:hypothetical protein